MRLLQKTRRAIVVLSIFLAAACSNGNGSPVSGHQVGISRSDRITDIGDVRIEIADVKSARNFPIPETRYFSFAWSPEGHRRLFKTQGWQRPTEKDWQRDAMLRTSGSSFAHHPNPERAKRARLSFFAERRRKDASSDFKMRVRPDGLIHLPACSGTVNGRHHCTGQLRLSQPEKLRLAAIVLAKFEPGCQVGRVDPPEMTRLRPGYKSSALSVFAQIQC